MQVFVQWGSSAPIKTIVANTWFVSVARKKNPHVVFAGRRSSKRLSYSSSIVVARMQADVWKYNVGAVLVAFVRHNLHSAPPHHDNHVL